MAWRVHLTDDVIYRLDILPGKTPLLCAWLNGQRAVLYVLETGAILETLIIEQPPVIDGRETAVWQEYLDTLKTPNGLVLPLVRFDNLTIHTTHNGQQYLYDDGHGLSVQLLGQREHVLGTADTQFVSVAMDRIRGLVSALDESGCLYLYRQHVLDGVYDIGLQPDEWVLPELVIATDASVIFASDGIRLVRVNGSGKVERERVLPYQIGKLACSPDGTMCATTDIETGIIRVYQGPDLAFMHQKFAIDLFAAAQQLQLLAGVATPRFGVSALTISNDGVLAFAIEGMVTVTHLSAMEQMPRPQSLP